MTRTTVYWVGADGTLHSRVASDIAPPPPPPPAKPTANARITNQTNLVVTFSGASSSAVSPATIVSYAWTFGDGQSGTGVTPTHTYAATGTYTATLTVTDSRSQTASTTVTATVTAGANQPPVASFTTGYPDQNNQQIVSYDGSASSDPEGGALTYAWAFGDGGAATGVSGSHTYVTTGTFAITLTVTDPQGLKGATSKQVQSNSTNHAPVAKIALTQASMTTTYTMAGSTDPDGDALTYDVDWGDGTAHSTGITNSHTYATVGPWVVTGTASDPKGASNSVTATATPSPNSGGGYGVKSPWATGSPTEGFPSSVRVVKASTLLTHGSQMELQTLISKLTAPSVIDISGEQVIVSTFNGGNSAAVNGGSNFLGLLGGVSGGSFDNQVTIKKDIFPASVISAISSNQSGTSAYAMIRTAAAIGGPLGVYLMGVHFVGADQGSIPNDGQQEKNGPARYKGIDIDLAAAGSLFQNCLLQGMNYSNGSTPPWEVGMVDSRRSRGLTVRRVELDGILPVGSDSRPSSSTADPFGKNWKRSGGFQFNADANTQTIDFSIHSGLVSGLTYSIAGTGNNTLGPTGNNSGNITLNNLYVEDQSTHGFSGVNLEMIVGYIHVDHPTIKMNGSGGFHLKLNNRLNSPNGPNLTDFTVTEPQWSGLGYNGMFAIGIAGWGSVQTTAPKVIVGGKQLTATTSASGNPATNYYIGAL